MEGTKGDSIVSMCWGQLDYDLNKAWLHTRYGSA